MRHSTARPRKAAGRTGGWRPMCWRLSEIPSTRCRTTGRIAPRPASRHKEGRMATREQVSELKTKMGEERAALIAAAGGLSREDALRVPQDAEGEEQWTALEQLAHL